MEVANWEEGLELCSGINIDISLKQTVHSFNNITIKQIFELQIKIKSKETLTWISWILFLVSHGAVSSCLLSGVWWCVCRYRPRLSVWPLACAPDNLFLFQTMFLQKRCVLVNWCALIASRDSKTASAHCAHGNPRGKLGVKFWCRAAVFDKTVWKCVWMSLLNTILSWWAQIDTKKI